MKVCNSCKVEKPITSFYNRGGGIYRPECNECRKEQLRSRNYSVSVDHKICNECKIDKPSTEFHKCRTKMTGLFPDCKNCRKAHSKASYQRRSEKIKTETLAYYYANKPAVMEKRKKTQKEKLKSDPFLKVTRNLRNRLYYALKNTVWKKNTHFASYIGCDRDTLVTHLESQFQPGMTWDNYGQWHIDHIVPLISAESEEQLYSLCHYLNLQPLWALDNIKKAAKR